MSYTSALSKRSAARCELTPSCQLYVSSELSATCSPTTAHAGGYKSAVSSELQPLSLSYRHTATVVWLPHTSATEPHNSATAPDNSATALRPHAITYPHANPKIFLLFSSFSQSLTACGVALTLSSLSSQLKHVAPRETERCLV